MLLNDITNKMDLGIVEKNLYSEASTAKGVPIYVILTSTNTIMSYFIRKVTKNKYSHATIAMNYYETISMGTTNKNFGIAVESILEFPDRNRSGDMKICRRYVPIHIYEKMVYQIEYYKKAWRKIDYSFGKLTNFFSWLPKKKISNYDNETSFICSEFVAMILGKIDDIKEKLVVKEGRSSEYILSPAEINDELLSSFEVIYEGPIYTMPMDLLYDADKKFISLKKKVVIDVLKKLNVKKIKHYSEAYNGIPSIFSYPTNTNAKFDNVIKVERAHFDQVFEENTVR